MKNKTDTTIGFRINADLKEKLTKMADEQSRTLSNLIILILQNYVEQREKEKFR